MNASPHPFRSALCLMLATPTSLLAQVPDGWFVTSHITNTAATPGQGGLWLHHPRGSVPSVPISGLPPQLVGPTNSSGSASVLILPDGRLLVGQHRTSPIYVWVLTLNGSAVVTTQLLLLGNTATPNNGHVDEMALLNGIEAVVVAPFITTGPLAGQPLGRVSWVTNTVVPIPMSPMPLGQPNAVATANGLAYVGTIDSATTPTTSRVYSVPVAGGAPSLLATVAGSINSMDFDRAGNLVVQTGGFGAHVFDPATARLLCTTPHVGIGTVNAFAFEPATGKLVVARNAPHDVEVMDPCSSSTVQSVVTQPVNGWGGLTGIDVAPDRRTYGAPSGVATTRWQLVQYAHGLPLVGNAQFALYVAAPPAPGSWFVSTGAATIPLAGIDVLLAPTSLLPMGPVGVGGWVSLAIPATASLRGLPLFAQCVFTLPAGLAATDGLRFTLL